MNFGVIVAKQNESIYVLAEGDYTDLQGLYDIYEQSTKDMEGMQVVLIPFDEDEFDNIKGQTELLIEEFKGYFKE